MRQRVITGFIFAIIVAGLYFPSLFLPDLILLFALPVGIIATYELIKAFKAGGFKPCVPLIIAGESISLVIYVVSRFLAFDLSKVLAFFLLLILSFCLACVILVPVVRQEEFADASGEKGGVGNTFVDGTITAGIILYIAFPLFCLISCIGFAQNGWYYMLLGVVSSWMSDVFAYFAGVTLGKHKIVPHISPKKSWEGCIGGVLGCAVIVSVYSDLVIYGLDKPDIGIVGFTVLTFIFGMFLSVVSQLGDWLASVIKRRVGIKDYGNIFPGHGGMMDRFDSTFFTIPVGCLLALTISVFFR